MMSFTEISRTQAEVFGFAAAIMAFPHYILISMLATEYIFTDPLRLHDALSSTL